MTGAEIKAVAAVLKKYFSNLSTEKTIDIATEILEAVGRG